MMLSTELYALQAAIRDFANKHEWDTAVTLTFKEEARLNHIEASKTLKHFLNLLRGQVWPNAARNGFRLQSFAVYEGSAKVRPHYHLALLRPSHISSETFSALIQDIWSKKIYWGAPKNLIKPADANWLAYITKLATKSVYSDAIDWKNVHLPRSGVNEFLP